MAKKVTGYVKLQIPAGEATPTPSVGPALGQHGANIVQFTKEFGAGTTGQGDMTIPVVITVCVDRSFSFIVKTPSAAVLIKKACNVKNGSDVSNKTKVTVLRKADFQKVAETKMLNLDTVSLGVAMDMIAGTARNMSVTIEE